MTAGALRDYLAAKEVRTKKDPANPAKPATQCSHLETFLRNGGTSVLCPLARCCLSASYYVRPDATDATMACLSCAVLCTREEAAAHMKAAAQSAGVNPHCIFADVERALIEDTLHAVLAPASATPTIAGGPFLQARHSAEAPLPQPLLAREVPIDRRRDRGARPSA